MPKSTQSTPERYPDLQQAFNSADYRSVAHLLARHQVKIEHRMTVAEVDAKLAERSLSPGERIAIKASLSRCGLMR